MTDSGPPARPETRGTLFVVATPIGNLEDITLRALRVLREANLIAAEDTRRTAQLLAHYDIRTKVISLHEHNERRRIPAILTCLFAGASVALVTDAGTPGASDPGMVLVKAARDHQVRVEAVPGPSAIIAALSVSGEPFDRFVFGGFPPVRSKDRKKWLSRMAQAHAPVVFFESPHRLRRTLAEIAAISVERPITLCRELTKIHEEVLTGTATELLARLVAPKGEFTLILGAMSSPDADEEPSLSTDAEARVGDLIGQRPEYTAGSKRDYLRGIAEQLGLKVGDVYRIAERLKSRS